MSDEPASRHAIGAFIQAIAHGALIRHWLDLADITRQEAINHFVRHASPQEQAQLAQSLLQVAATYPDCAVRCELIGVYGVFQVATTGKVDRSYWTP